MGQLMRRKTSIRVLFRDAKKGRPFPGIRAKVLGGTQVHHVMRDRSGYLFVETTSKRGFRGRQLEVHRELSERRGVSQGSTAMGITGKKSEAIYFRKKGHLPKIKITKKKPAK